MAVTICPGCGAKIKSNLVGMDGHYNASQACKGVYDELSGFTLSLGDRDFIHQLVVDAYAAQHSSPKMKPITVTFALIGLYLVLERGYSGKEVQRAHMAIANTKREWPFLVLSSDIHFEVTVSDVWREISKENYKERIDLWIRSVWKGWSESEAQVRELVDRYIDSEHQLNL